MDWQAFVARFEDPGGPDGFEALFADGGLFCDPVTPWTTDVRKVAEDTDRIFPDWSTRVDELRAGDHWAVLQWTGTATFTPEDGKGIPIEMHGATVVEVNDAGKIVSWRDYLDTNEPLNQIRAGSG